MKTKKEILKIMTKKSYMHPHDGLVLHSNMFEEVVDKILERNEKEFQFIRMKNEE